MYFKLCWTPLPKSGCLNSTVQINISITIKRISGLVSIEMFGYSATAESALKRNSLRPGERIERNGGNEKSILLIVTLDDEILLEKGKIKLEIIIILHTVRNSREFYLYCRNRAE